MTKGKKEMELRQLRIRHNMLQRDLGAILNVSPQTVSSWEKGRTNIPSDKKRQIAELFKINESEIENKSKEEPESVNIQAQLRRDHLDLIMREHLSDEGMALTESIIGLMNGLQYFDSTAASDKSYNRFQVERAVNYSTAIINALAAFVYDCGSTIALRSSEDVRALERDLNVLRSSLNQLIQYCLNATAESVSINDEKDTEDENQKRQQNTYTNIVKSFADKYASAFRLNPAEEQQE